jgi:Zn finger protein HypA/HybF involved in hydrogenase expression
MKPEKALELVGKYARLTKSIKATTKEIGSHLGCCKGLSGKRLDFLLSFSSDESVVVDSKNRELDLHLVNWYTPEIGEYGWPSWEVITEDEHKNICPHCYASHLAIAKRKELRKELGSVKRSMSRSIS